MFERPATKKEIKLGMGHIKIKKNVFGRIIKEEINVWFTRNNSI
jgi:hypothetical protein